MNKKSWFSFLCPAACGGDDGYSRGSIVASGAKLMAKKKVEKTSNEFSNL